MGCLAACLRDGSRLAGGALVGARAKALYLWQGQDACGQGEWHKEARLVLVRADPERQG